MKTPMQELIDEQEILKMIRRTFHSQSGLFLNRRQSEDVALYIIKLINEDKSKL